jgi:LysM repeat protein
MIIHDLREGETLASIAQRYHVPVKILAEANGLDEHSGLKGKTRLQVPVGAYNHLLTKPAGGEARPLIYEVAPGDDLFKISWRANVSPNKLKEWNSLKDKNVQPGSHMMIGWVRYDGPPTPERLPDTPRVVVRGTSPTPGDTTRNVVKSDEESPEDLYLKQIQDGQNLITERGPAVFFHMPVNSGGDLYYAFHNNAPKGTIVKVVNPGTHAVIYVKVLGPMPNTKQYHNALIGISDRAKGALGVRDTKAWCELSYTGY